VTDDCHALLHCVDKTTSARARKTPTGKQMQSRPAAGVSRSANIYAGVYGSCLYACDSCSGMILRWKSCAAGIPPGNDPSPARCHGIPPPHGCRRVRRGRLESSAAVFVGDATGRDRAIVGSGDG
jgi:hypothetical protein